MAVVTRLGLTGVPRSPYGSFSGKTVAEVDVVQRGGSSKKSRRPPYRVDEERRKLYEKFGTDITPFEQRAEPKPKHVRVADGSKRPSAVRVLPPASSMSGTELDAEIAREFRRIDGISAEAGERLGIADDEAALMLLLVA